MAKVGLMKKYLKAAKGDFSKAWKLQKKAKAGIKKTTKKVKKAISKAVTKTKKGVSKMAKNPKTKIIYRKAMPISKEVLSGATTVTSILGSNLLVNKLPGLKDVDPKFKAGGQILAGAVLAGVTKKKYWKWAGAGLVAAGLLNLSKEFPLTASLSGAEDSPTLTAEEMRLLTQDRSSLLGVPASSGSQYKKSYKSDMGAPSSVVSAPQSGWNLKS